VALTSWAALRFLSEILSRGLEKATLGAEALILAVLGGTAEAVPIPKRRFSKRALLTADY